jgi:hypothetical protein
MSFKNERKDYWQIVIWKIFCIIAFTKFFDPLLEDYDIYIDVVVNNYLSYYILFVVYFIS